MFKQFHQRLNDLREAQFHYRFECRCELEREMEFGDPSRSANAEDFYRAENCEYCKEPDETELEAMRRMQEFEQRVHAAEKAEEVFVISAPHNAKAARAAVLVANTLKQRGNKVFVFDPNVDMEVFAQSLHQFDKHLQDKRWLQIWTDFVLYAATKGTGHSGVIFLCDGMPTSTDLHVVDQKLPGNAQHGEYRIALLAGFNDQNTGLHFVDINRPVLAIP